MAAATTETLSSRVKNGFKAILDLLYKNMEEQQPEGIITSWNDIVAIPTTALDDINDLCLLSPKWPAGTYIQEFRGNPSDMDSATGLVYNIEYVNTSGATQLILVTGSTKGQTGSGTDRIADAAVGRFVGEGYVAMRITTPATTPVAGTYKLHHKISIGTGKPSKTPRGPYKLEAEV